MDETRVSHLEMVQGVIGRMASNSLALKSLAATISAATIALAASQPDRVTSPNNVALMSLIPIGIFWFLDAYYLRIERAFRGLFDAIRRDQNIEPFSMDHRPYVPGVRLTASIAFSFVMLVYPALMFLVLVVAGIAG